MASCYLQPVDYPNYGLANTTLVSQVTQASALIDAYLERPEGLVWSPDFSGLPCYMSGGAPTMTFNSSGSIASGSSVVIPITQASAGSYNDMIGDVVILDRTNPTLTEACVISAMTQGQITLSSVQKNHSSNCTMDLGLVIFEEKALPQERSITRTSRPPLRLLSGMGRYGYGRRTEQTQGMFMEVNLLAEIQAFGGPPMWVPFNVNQCSISYTTREVWVPAGILLAYFSDVRLRYISGWTYAALPAVIKQATAQLVQNFQNNPQLSGMMKSIASGTTTISRFAPSQLDNDTRQMLEAYRVRIVI